jgi:hypothetical protein
MKKVDLSSVSSLPEYQGLHDSLPGEVDYPPGGSAYGTADWMALALAIIIAVPIGFVFLLQWVFGD